MRILFLDLDTLRPDHLGCYGYHRNTSPNIDKIAEEGVCFNNYYCSDAPCLPSRTALMTGRFGIHNGVVGHGGTAADVHIEGASRDFRDRLATESLPGFLRSQGFRTVSISPFAERHSSWTFYAGFNEMYNTGKCGGESAEDIMPTVKKWIKDNAKEDNWFLHINFWDAHTPYRTPAEFGNPFEDEPIPAWITEDILKEHRNLSCPHGAQEINMYDNKSCPQFPRHPGEIKDLGDLKKLFDGYDCGIRYMDEKIGKIFEEFEKQGVREDLAIIITGDHGENLGELGIYAEHATADNLTCHVPMIIRWPGGVKGHLDNGLHYNLDLAPTLAGLFKANPVSSWDGQSYADTILNGNDTGREELILSQCAHVCQRSVRFDNWIYIRTYHDGYRLYPKEMLFDIEKDPYEQRNLAEERRNICKEAAYRLFEWHDRMMASMECSVDPLWTVMQEGGPYHTRGYLKRYCERLEKTGRAWAVPELKRRHAKEFK